MIRAVIALVCLSVFAVGQQSGPLEGLANLSDAVSKRISSADRSGGNADWIEVKANSTVTLADISGAGSIRHIWFTINSPSPFHLRELVLRMCARVGLYLHFSATRNFSAIVADFFAELVDFSKKGTIKSKLLFTLPIMRLCFFSSW